MIEKLRGVIIPPFQVTKTWTFDQIAAWWRKLKLRREIKNILKDIKNVEKN